MNSGQSRWFILMVLALIWGSSFILMKKALINLSPVQVGAIRILLSGLTLFSVGWKNFDKVSKKQWFYIAVTAFLGTFFPVFLFAYAVQEIDSSIVSILNSLTPLNTLVVGAVFFGFNFIRKQFLGVLIGLLGASFLILKGASIHHGQEYQYALLVVIASVGYSFNVNIIKKHLQNISSLTIVTGNFMIIFLPALVVLWRSEFFDVQYIKAARSSIVYLALLSVFGTAMAKTLFNKLIQLSSPVFSSSVTYIIPMVAIFWGVLDGERIEASQYLAGGIIIAGVYLTNKVK